MIYLITGIPGSGKTLYAVSTLIRQLLADKLTLDDGSTVDRRLVVDGIPGLALDCLLMDKTEVSERNISWADGARCFGNWMEWAQPGDVLVVDEVQRICRPRTMGSKPPPFVTAMETHRHHGVDMVLITQSPMLLDQNVRRLVGRHQHIRRLLGMQRAIIYDWDGCQADVSRVGAATKSYFNYPKDAYKLYTSASLHTKQRQRVPLWVIVPVLAIVGGVFAFPRAYQVISGSMSGKGLSGLSGGVPAVVASPAGPSTVPIPLPVVDSSVKGSVPVLSDSGGERPVYIGCIAVKGRCGCFDSHGISVDFPVDQCLVKAGVGRGAPATFPDSPLPVLVDNSFNLRF